MTEQSHPLNQNLKLRNCTVCNIQKTLDKFRANEKFCRKCRVEAEKENRSLTDEEFEEELKKMDLNLKPPHI